MGLPKWVPMGPRPGPGPGLPWDGLDSSKKDVGKHPVIFHTRRNSVLNLKKKC